ncbi:MAG TPA: hypothetical protein DF296_00640 [Candidatus Margulisbacteria bacterium]|nr:MAG: hypothetical protein A2X09_17490 [Bacteroidetes bacterium GWF2_43_11]OGI11313.1 MAG: hypothetical protein A2X41_04305 [Candidatus Margulisbacteria bacterium GWE2_39_32]HCT83690.1 hypothetical protein [Candidatus Margulisiibacteriota bacterium]
MRKFALFAFLFSLLTIGTITFAVSGSNQRVEVVVVGATEHGPMQPTVKAIKDVAAKYGNKVKLTIYSFESEEGIKYMEAHTLTAHLNIVINGKYKYPVNDKVVTFQWFEGQQWTKKDLDAVINNILNTKKNK